MATLKEITERAAARARRIAESPEVQRAVEWAQRKTQRVRHNFAEARREVTRRLADNGEDDLKSLKRQLDAMQAEAKREKERAMERPKGEG